MDHENNTLAFKLPKWVFASISLSPILLWPLIFYGSVFIFDDPNANVTLQYIAFFAINSYPIFLIINMLYANKLYSRANKLCIALYLWPITLFGLLVIYIFLS